MERGREGRSLRMSTTTKLVLAALLDDVGTPRYGLQICHETGLASGTVHPILARLEGAGWVTSRWEEVDPRVAGRPARRFYQLTDDGADRAGAALTTAPARSARLRSAEAW